ncbi:MAG: DUF3068 domain-containing protein [Corynebacterium sp.]|nr:DUF3068 domain-containing protein [Corynebacterium sp.]
MRSSVLRNLCIGVSIMLLTVGILMPFTVTRALKVIPLDLTAKTTTDVLQGTLMDATAFAEGTTLPEHADDPACQLDEHTKPMSCFIGNSTALRGIRNISVVEPSDKERITLKVANVLLRVDRESPNDLVDATVDTVTLTRKTGYPVSDPISTFEIAAPDLNITGNTGSFARDGVQYTFPFGMKREPIEYFDIYAQASHPLNYVEDTEVGGIDAYKMHQNVGAVNLFDVYTEVANRKGGPTENEELSLAALKLESTAGRWYTAEELAAQGLEAESPVTMTRYYSIDRTIWVEPETGAILDGVEHLNFFFAQNQEEAQKMADSFFANPDGTPNVNRTALNVRNAWDDQTRAAQHERAEEGIKGLKMLRTITWGLIILGLIGLGVAALGAARARKQ